MCTLTFPKVENYIDIEFYNLSLKWKLWRKGVFRQIKTNHLYNLAYLLISQKNFNMLTFKTWTCFQGFIFEVSIWFLVLAKGEFYAPILVPVPSKWYWVKSWSQELEPELSSLTIQTKELANIDLYGFLYLSPFPTKSLFKCLL